MALCMAAAILLSMPLAAEEPLRGLVVDRGDDVLWLGFPSAAQKGMVFNVMLVSGGEAIARAEVTEATPDAPYVAKASFKMLDKKAFIPVGAYVEATKIPVADRDETPGYHGVALGPKGLNPLSFQVGAFFPTEDALSDETDQAWPAVQLEYMICRKSSISIGLGFYGRGGNFEVGGIAGERNIQVYPVTVNAKLKLSGEDRNGWFGKVGAGAFIVNDERTLGGITEKTNTTTIGWQAGIGYESKGRSAQLSYVDGRQQDFKGISLTLGARF